MRAYLDTTVKIVHTTAARLAVWEQVSVFSFSLKSRVDLRCEGRGGVQEGDRHVKFTRLSRGVFEVAPEVKACA